MEKVFELVKGRHSIGESNFHLQFTAAYRRKIFGRERVQKLTRAYLESRAHEMGLILWALDFGPDHVHLFVGNCRTYSVSQLANSLKGFVSRMMRKNHRRLFGDLLWGQKFWTSGYFYRSVGSVTSEAMKFYVAHAQRKHWEVVDEEFFAHAGGQRGLGEFIFQDYGNPFLFPLPSVRSFRWRQRRWCIRCFDQLGRD